MRDESVTGLVLAGGLGRRMGGVEKGLLPFCGRPLLAHVLEHFAPQVDELIISTNGNPDDYKAFGHRLVADRIAGRAGPLAGLQAGLAACTTALLAAVPCDAPHLPADLVSTLYAALVDSQAQIATAVAAGRRQPTFMLCRTMVRADLESYLAGGGRKFGAWLADMNAVEVHFSAADAFANINTPEDLACQEAARPDQVANR